MDVQQIKIPAVSRCSKIQEIVMSQNLRIQVASSGKLPDQLIGNVTGISPFALMLDGVFSKMINTFLKIFLRQFRTAVGLALLVRMASIKLHALQINPRIFR